MSVELLNLCFEDNFFYCRNQKCYELINTFFVLISSHSVFPFFKFEQRYENKVLETKCSIQGNGFRLMAETPLESLGRVH